MSERLCCTGHAIEYFLTLHTSEVFHSLSDRSERNNITLEMLRKTTNLVSIVLISQCIIHILIFSAEVCANVTCEEIETLTLCPPDSVPLSEVVYNNGCCSKQQG